MKTAISLPDELFSAADALASQLGVSRSELYATAVAEYLAKHSASDVTARLECALRDRVQRTRSGIPACTKPLHRTRGVVGTVLAGGDTSRRGVVGGPAGTARIGARLSQACPDHSSGCLQPQPNRHGTGPCPHHQSSAGGCAGKRSHSCKGGRASQRLGCERIPVITIDRSFLDERAGRLQTRYMAAVDAGLKLVLNLT